MRVTIVEQGFRKRHPYKWLRDRLFRPYWFPVEDAQAELADLDLKIAFADSVTDHVTSSDVVILSSRTIDHLASLEPGLDRAAVCRRAGARGARVVWFDTRDSTGNCQFDVMPDVSIYLKRQVLRDRSRYAVPTYFGRVHSDYYHQHYGVDDGDEKLIAGSALTSGGLNKAYRPEEVLADPIQLAKMRAAWGCGAEFHWPQLQAGAMAGYLTHRALDSLTGRGGVRPDVQSADRPRSIDVASLFDEARYDLASVGHQRKLALGHTRLLDHLTVSAGRVSRKAFYNTLADSKITVSTFGWGEVCFREYEATYCGSAVLMADMSHVETYPDFYRADETYVPFKWDFSDFAERVDDMLSDPAGRLGRVRAAQDLLTAQWTREGREQFASRFLQLITP